MCRYVWEKSFIEVSEYLKFMTFLSECIAATDCPNGGTNFLCSANICECLSPNVLHGEKCVGMLTFEKELIKSWYNLTKDTAGNIHSGSICILCN